MIFKNYEQNALGSSVQMTLLTAAVVDCFIVSLTLRILSLYWRLIVELVVSKLFFFQNFTVSSVQLSSVRGVQSIYTEISLPLQRRLTSNKM